MCDEYYDERMRVFRRALAEADQDEELDEEAEEPIEKPIVVTPIELRKTRPKTLAH
ncbi:MAG: hypothetical protein L3J78_02660 [Thermoplasmata archaeon]|nr:hypothetical protein [Thermoplasmata archaeon]